MKKALHLIFTFLVLCAGPASAETSPMMSWTSNDDHTIRARFIGVSAHCVLIEKGGTVFTVPFTRLAPHSVEQAQRLGSRIGRDEAPSAVRISAVVKPVVLAKPVVYRRPSLPQVTPPPAGMAACTLALSGKTAAPTGEVPYTVHRAIEAGNFLQTKPYIWGGGHGSVIDHGYDCSGSTSYVLIQAGLLHSPLTSSGFAHYGLPGPGKWITIYAGRGHVFMTICGLRLDTGGRSGRGESGPRWVSTSRCGSGLTVRHPPGF